MSLESKFETFKNKHGLNDDAIGEILVIFNEAFIELAHKLLKNGEIPESKKPYSGPKKFATKIAAEYAAENDLTLDDFDKEKITKKDIDEKIKNNVKKSASKKVTKTENIETVTKTPVTTKEKCKGITKTGEACSRPGTEKPDGSKNCYCFRHAIDWKNYEVSSDSELEEEDIFTDPNQMCKEIMFEQPLVTDLAITTEE